MGKIYFFLKFQVSPLFLTHIWKPVPPFSLTPTSPKVATTNTLKLPQSLLSHIPKWKNPDWIQYQSLTLPGKIRSRSCSWKQMPSGVSVSSCLEKVLHSLNLRDVQDTGRRQGRQHCPFGVPMESPKAIVQISLSIICSLWVPIYVSNCLLGSQSGYPKCSSNLIYPKSNSIFLFSKSPYQPS